VPVFPLPDLVFFPGTVVPLHIFEHRYREMVRDAASGEKLLGLALLRPGFERDYQGAPEIHPVGTVGVIEDLRPLPDGRFLLDLRGLCRVRYDEIASDKPYRLARIRPCPESASGSSESDLEAAKLSLLTTQALLTRALSGGDTPALVNDKLPLEAAVNRACLQLPVAAELRQELLALDELEQRRQRVSRLLDEILQHVLSERCGPAGGDLPS
jgi:Lon protease-like protein